MCVLSRVQLFATPWTVVGQASLSMGLLRQECGSGLPFPPGDLSHPGIKPTSLVSPALTGGFFTTEPPGKPPGLNTLYKNVERPIFQRVNLEHLCSSHGLPLFVFYTLQGRGFVFLLSLFVLFSDICWCSFTQSCLIRCSSMDCGTPGFPVLHYLLEFAQNHVH